MVERINSPVNIISNVWQHVGFYKKVGTCNLQNVPCSCTVNRQRGLILKKDQFVKVNFISLVNNHSITIELHSIIPLHPPVTLNWGGPTLPFLELCHG